MVKVTPAYTSQRCSACGFVKATARAKPSSCATPRAADTAPRRGECGHQQPNAAGHAVSVCGDPGISRSVMQEP
ncbi:hypothetical protein ACSHXN_44505 (plasmid) [Streptomyces sp. HUAS TT11]|uniref:hypothetical protein n=1 Tax=Streptomyces sp. HUAS TT11 TaxID=3447508 RepID=UPI003F6601F8